jgi:hypothetical protein
MGHSQAVPKSSANQLRIAKLTEHMDNLDINGNGANNYAIILQRKECHKSHESLNADDDDDEGEFDLPVVKKKKRSVTL